MATNSSSTTAKIETKTRVVERVVQDTVTDETVVLTMPREVARSLRAVTTRVGGLPDGRRGHIDAISAALWNAGVRLGLDEAREMFNDGAGYGSVYFKDTRVE